MCRAQRRRPPRHAASTAKIGRRWRLRNRIQRRRKAVPVCFSPAPCSEQPCASKAPRHLALNPLEMRYNAGDVFAKLLSPALPILIYALCIAMRKSGRIKISMFGLGDEYLRGLSRVNTACLQQQRQIEQIATLQPLQNTTNLLAGNFRQGINKNAGTVRNCTRSNWRNRRYSRYP